MLRAPLWKLVIIALSCAATPGQERYVVWGTALADSDMYRLPATQVVASASATALLRLDGRVFVRGITPSLPSQPVSPIRKIGIGTTGRGAYLLADGTIFDWMTWVTVSRPPLPPGLLYTDIAVGGDFAVALRSDGVVVGWGSNCSFGQCWPPTPPAGLRFVEVAAGGNHALARLSDGSVVGWGDSRYGQLIPPTLPPNASYVAVSAGYRHSLALRSDGQVVAWGDNQYGQCNVPALAPPARYLSVAAATTHSLATVSDGSVLAWGDNSSGQCNVPPFDPGNPFVECAGGDYQSVARRRDGSVVTWGDDYNWAGPMPLLDDAMLDQGMTFTAVSSGYWRTLLLRSDGQIVGTSIVARLVPPLPAGVVYTKVSLGYDPVAALRSDGNIVMWGGFNLCNCATPPPLPAGVVYTDVACGTYHVVALRSDGQAVRWGSATQGPTAPIPALPAGLSWSRVAASQNGTLLLRSDGQIVQIVAGVGVVSPPPLPPGVAYDRMAANESYAIATRTDGTAVSWDMAMPNQRRTVPALPPGVAYVDVAAYGGTMFLRRSDGQLATIGYTTSPDYTPPPLDPGTSYTAVAAGWGIAIALVGAEGTYQTFASGCGGSRPATRLVPRDTPRIGHRLPLNLLDLPLDIAFLCFAWSPTRIGSVPTPIPLAPLGMPGCFGNVPPDAVVPVAGANNTATFTITVPRQPALVGLRFYNQAFVPDPLANNPVGAVVSDACVAKIGT